MRYKNTIPAFLLSTLILFLSSPAYANPSVPCMTNGAVLTDPTVRFCFSFAGQAAWRLSIFELLPVDGTNAVITHPLLETLVTEYDVQFYLSNKGSGNYKYRMVALDSLGKLMTGPGSQQQGLFTLQGLGPEMYFVPTLQTSPGKHTSFDIKTSASVEGDEIYSIICFDPSLRTQIQCPTTMSIDEVTGIFRYHSPIAQELDVLVTCWSSSGTDSQMFRVISADEQPGSGVAPILTNLLVLSNSDPTSPLATVASTEAPNHNKEKAVDAMTNSGLNWLPTTNDQTWSITMRINSPQQAPNEQRLFMVDEVVLDFGPDPGTGIPDTTIPGQLQISYSTDFNGSPNSFVPVPTDLVLDPLFDPGAQYGWPCEAIGDECTGKVRVGRDAAYIKISGSGVRPSIEEIIIRGWKGEADCAPIDNTKWRTIAFVDIDKNCRADTPLTVVTSGCYGIAQALPCGRVAPEWIASPPSICNCRFTNLGTTRSISGGSTF